MEGELLAISEEERVLVEFETLGHVTGVPNVTDKPGDKTRSCDMLHADEVVQPQGPCVARGAESESRDMQPDIQDVVSPCSIAGSQHSPLTSETADLQQRCIDAMNLPPRLHYVYSMVIHCNIGYSCWRLITLLTKQLWNQELSFSAYLSIVGGRLPASSNPVQ